MPDKNAHSCAFCGLPIQDERSPETQSRYCCYGCRIAASVVAANGDEGQARWAMTRLGLAVFFAMNVMVFTMLLWSQEDGATDQVAGIWYELARYACLIFTMPVVLLLSGPLLEDAACELRRYRPSLSLLLCVGVAASLVYSVYSLLWVGGHVYFEVACTILVAVTLGRWLEATGKLRTTEALRKLSQLQPEQVCLCDGDGDRIIAASELRPGDCFRVLPGEHVAADGKIVRFSAAVSEQTITGESLPVFKQVGDAIQSGVLVLDGPLVIRARVPAGEGMLARMVAAVNHVTASRTRYERLAERVATWFLPFVALVAVATFAVHSWRGHSENGLLAALAVLVIACPCALGLATPMALWAAVGRAASAGVLIRDGNAIELLARASTICFDKTGTLTTGEARVAEFLVGQDCDADHVLRVAQALSANSNHPLATAITKFAGEKLANGIMHPAIGEVRVVPGCGIVAKVADCGGPAMLGNEAWLAANSLAILPPGDSFNDAHKHALAETFVGWDGKARGRFLFSEQVRPEVEFAIHELKRAGLRCVVLTGDRKVRGDLFAKRLAIESRTQLSPEDKLAAITQMQAAGKVIMVGDGINDAPALAAADVGIALGSGLDIARDTAEVCLLADDLARLPWLIDISRKTVRTIRWNLLWAFAYNTVGIGLAAAGWLHPIVAAIAMGASGFMVVANSLRLAHFAMDSTCEQSTSSNMLDAPLSHHPLPINIA